MNTDLVEQGRVEIRASLRIMGNALDPEQVSSLLGTPADESHRLGEARSGKTVRAPYSEGLWLRRSKCSEKSSLAVHVSELLSFFQECVDGMEALRKQGNRIDLCVGIFSTDLTAGVTLDCELERELARAQVPLHLDFYCVDDE